jgi:pimeloyl-ACP methyl ester carboxylesterase
MARLVMVHGAFGSAHVWEPVTPGLVARGHTVEALDLPGQGADPAPVPEVSLDAYATRVLEVLAAGPPATLVGHSMGGMSITQAAARAPELIEALIYVAAFLPEPGESLMALTHFPEAAGDMIQANLEVDGEPPVGRLSDEAAAAAIYNCCTPDQVAWGLAHRGVQPLVPMTQPLELDAELEAAFRALPRRYVTCLRDNCIMPAMQRLMFERGGCDPVLELDTDHAPYLSRTDELVDALDRLASLRPAVAG